MTQTNDERREVAETMRVISGEGVNGLTLGEVLNSILTGGAPRPTTEMAILAHIADLIDPVCTPVVDDVYGMPDELVCSECGCCLAITVDGKPSAPLSRYCPCCGARIVEEKNANG